MSKHRSGLLLAATVLLVAAPTASATEALLPPGNSAAAQYTEAIPTGGGEKSTEGTGPKHRGTPGQTLGAKNAKRLESRGAVGRATAELASETAPSGGLPSPPQVPSRPYDHAGGGRQAGGTAVAPSNSEGASEAANPTARSRQVVTEPSGSSGLGSVVAEATGTSASGQMGAFLPLAILAAISWSAAYLLRQRRHIE